MEVRREKTKQNSKYMWCGDRDETINHMISKCHKLPEEQYKTRRDGVGKVIHRELCKRLKFDHTNKWYMHKPESVLENERHKLLLDFEIQTDYPISDRQPDLVIIKKKENQVNNELCRPVWPQSKIERKQKER